MQVKSIGEHSKSIGEHSPILSTFIQLPFVIHIFVLSIFEWPLKTGFTVCVFVVNVLILVLINIFNSFFTDMYMHKIMYSL